MSEFYNSFVGETGKMPPKPSRDDLLTQLRDLLEGDPEAHHHIADMLLLAYIDDNEVTAAFRALERWYA